MTFKLDSYNIQVFVLFYLDFDSMQEAHATTNNIASSLLPEAFKRVNLAVVHLSVITSVTIDVGQRVSWMSRKKYVYPC